LAKIVAIDYGARRIGLAIADRETGLALPWRVVQGHRSPDADAETVWNALAESDETIDTVVVGLPVNMDGTEGEQAKRTREFAGALRNVSQIHVLRIEFWDERLSSFAADQRYRRPEKRPSNRRKGKTRPGKHIDAVAAAVILEDYLDHSRRHR